MTDLTDVPELKPVLDFDGSFHSEKYEKDNYRKLQKVDLQVMEMLLRQQAALGIPAQSCETIGIIGSAAVLMVPNVFARVRAKNGRFELMDPTESNLLRLGQQLGFQEDPFVRADLEIWRKFEAHLFRSALKILGREEAKHYINALQSVLLNSRGVDGDINQLPSHAFDLLVEAYVAYAITTEQDEVLFSWEQMLQATKIGGYVTSISFLNSSPVYPGGKQDEGIGCPATPIDRMFILEFLNTLRDLGYIRFLYGETRLRGKGMPREGAEEAAVWTAQILKPLPEVF